MLLHTTFGAENFLHYLTTLGTAISSRVSVYAYYIINVTNCQPTINQLFAKVGDGYAGVSLFDNFDRHS